jgi:glycosyltransferase involved in cell wall biosynthesis
MNELMLSIYVPVFNHEKYIEKALDSILMQETEYSYEVLVGEDCSKDNSREILREYERKHPNKIKVFYREKNMNNEKVRNSIDLRMRCRGKYIIILEGDDYWTDPLKIQKQIDFLEKHPEYWGVTHRCVVVDENSQPNGEKYPESDEGEYTYKHFVSEIMPGHSTTFMYKNPEVYKEIDTGLMYQNLVPGDRLTFFTILLYGKIYCMDDVMSAYRHVKKGGTSYSATLKYDFNRQEDWHRELCVFAEKSQNRKAFRYAKLLYLRHILIAFKQKDCSLKVALKKARKRKCSLIDWGLYTKCWIRHHLLQKKIWV